MNNKKWYLIAVFFLLGALFLSACGGSEPATEETADEPATTDTTEEEAADEEMEEEEAADEEMEEEATDEEMEEEAADEEMEEEATDEEMEEEAADEEMEEEAADEEFDVSITIWADDTRAPILLALAEDFQAEYGVGLVVEQVADIRDQFVIAAPAGEGPDIILGAHDWLGQLVDSGLLAPMDLGDKADSFTDVSKTGFTFDGQLYGMPYATENLAFFYNTELVAEPPTTWAEVMEVGGALQADGTVTYAMGLTGTTYDAFPLQTAFGGYIFGQDADGNYDPSDVGIDSPGMIAAGDFLQQAVADGLISDSTDWDTNHVLFETGEVPFLMAGPWALNRIRESGVPYGITTFPDGGQPFAGVQGFMVNALSENVLLAQAFLTEFVATEEVMSELYLDGNRHSAFIPVLEATDDPDIILFGEAGVDAVLMPAIPEMGAVWSSWGDAFSLILTQELTADEALTTGAFQIRDLIGSLDTLADMVNVPGSWQAASGACTGDWDPACEGSALTDNGDGTFSGTFDLPAGDYEVKVALAATWDTNYGVDGEADGANYMFTMSADGSVTFTYDSETNLLDIVTP
ncbi:extracellular solute-binding protein [Candidatus Leptofilum sp.]|uniref:extracellular solute-binding protein n=1 Tax=Candidatus Leptofilum sp. TaxID=3241576 RepID=UPI003B592B20